MPKPCIVVGIIICLFFMGALSYAKPIYLPAFDPINSDIIELQSQGYLPQLSQTERPWLIGDIVSAILDNELSFDPSSRTLAEKILVHLEPYQMIAAESTNSGGQAGLGIRALSRERREGHFYLRDKFISRDYRGEFSSVYKGRVWLAREAKWGVDSELIFDSDGTRYPWYYGTAHNGRIIGQFDRAYLNFILDRFTFLFGRQRLNWGSSPRGSLILDDKSPPMDLLGYGFRLKPIAVSGFFTRLDDYLDTLGIVNRRFLAGHRIAIMPGKGWEIALSETYLYGGKDRLPELYYAIPVVLFYWEAQNRKQDDNAFWALDISWVKSRVGRFYFQFVFDDIQRQHRGPQKFAFQLGTHLVPSRLEGWSGLFEINFVDTYVYGQRKRLNAYLNWNWTIGRLDSDQREYFAGIYKRLGRGLKAGAEFVGRDKGENYAASFQPGMAPFGVKFPSGTVEKTREFTVVVSGDILRRMNFDLRAGRQSIDNWRHIDGWSLGQFIFSLQASADFNFGIPFWKRLP